MQNLYENKQSQPGRPETEAPVYRIGGVSRLAGVPVTTLRVWERRYGAFVPAKSEGQHRLYGDDDVIRARLMRQLTEGGTASAPSRGWMPTRCSSGWCRRGARRSRSCSARKRPACPSWWWARRWPRG